MGEAEPAIFAGSRTLIHTVRMGNRAFPIKNPASRPMGIPIAESRMGCRLISRLICYALVPRVFNCP